MTILNKFLNLKGDGFESLNEKFQYQIEKLYKSYFKDLIFKNELTDDVEILNRVTELSKYKLVVGVPSYARYLPSYQLNYKFPGMECTLSNAILKLALQSAGFKNVFTLLVRGHMVTGRFTKESLTIYDPSTQITKEGILTGFVYTFDNKFVNLTQLTEEKYAGNVIRISVNEEIPNTGLFELVNGFYVKKFYVLPNNIHIHLVTILRNLEEYFKDDDKEMVKNCLELISDAGEDNPHTILNH